MPLGIFDKIVLDMPCTPLAGQGAVRQDIAVDWSQYNTPIGGLGAWLTSAESKFPGEKSLLFDGSRYGAAPYSEQWNLSGNIFTIEAYVNLTGDTGASLFGTVLSKRVVGAEFDWALWHSGSTKLWYFTFGDGSTGRRDIYAPSTYTLGGWNHVCAMADGTTVKVFQNGVPSGSTTISGSLRNRVIQLDFGRSNTYADSYLNGNVNYLRVTKSQLYSMSGFTPPVLGDFDYGYVSNLSNSLIPSGVTKTGSAIPAVSTSLLGKPFKVRDREYGGSGMIVATVKEKSSPDNLPLIRRVVLHRHRDNVAVGETWSDAGGNYAFTSIAQSEKYYAVSFDHLGNYRGAIADNLTPTMMVLP